MSEGIVFPIYFRDVSDMEDDTGDDSKSVKTNDESKKWVFQLILHNPPSLAYSHTHAHNNNNM